MARSNFKVIIAGGGIGGVGLANSLQLAGVDYVLVEKGERLDPQVGASIGILPSGARILDQLGCYRDLEFLTVGMEKSATRSSDGSMIGGKSDALKLMEQRTGYSVFFLDRQILLRVLADHVQDKSKIKLNTTIKKIEQFSDKIEVYCKDGTIIEGDIVVGSDGVHSLTRHEMWRHADHNGDGEKFEKDKKAMSAEYKCLFGVSTNVPGMSPGQTDRTYAKDVSTLSYVGKEGRVFWFVFIKMDGMYFPPNIPKFSKEDAAKQVSEIASLPIREHGKVTIQDLYDTNVACNLVAVEEASYEHWSYDRVVCMGDAVHKMTPNLGAGASSALESAAELSNVIIPLTKVSSKPSLQVLRNAFASYQRARELRVNRASQFSNSLTRVQALKGQKEYFYTHYVAPMMDDFAAEMFSNFVIGASAIDHLPVPVKSTEGTMPFNPEQGWGHEESKVTRAIRALPLLGLAVFSLDTMWKNNPSLLSQPYGPPADFAKLPLTDYIHADIAYGLWLLESTRLCNKGSFAQLPLLFGLALQQFGASVVIPTYFFLLYIRTPIESFRASDNRLTDSAYTGTVGPLVFLLGLIPKYLYQHDILTQEVPIWSHHISILPWIVRLQPVVLWAAQFLLAHSLFRSTIGHDRIWKPRRDVPWVRCSVANLVAASAVPWLRSMVGSYGMLYMSKDIFTRDEIFSILASIFWLALSWDDLRSAGMVEASSCVIAGLQCIIALACLGPGGMLAVGWLMREEILIFRRHKSAKTEAG